MTVDPAPSEGAAPWLIYGRMAAVLAALPSVAKTKQNTDQGFPFRGIDDVVNALSECLSAQQIFYLPSTLERISEVRQTRGGASLWVVHLHVAFTFYAPDGSNVTADTWGEGVDMADKATSKAHTFALKACLLEAFNIATADLEDPDGSGEASVPVPRDVFVEGGWAGKAEHDAARVPLREAYRRLDGVQRDAFAVFCKQHGIVAKAPWSRAEADLVGGFLAEVGVIPALAEHECVWDEVDGRRFCGVCETAH